MKCTEHTGALLDHVQGQAQIRAVSATRCPLHAICQAGHKIGDIEKHDHRCSLMILHIIFCLQWFLVYKGAYRFLLMPFIFC